MSSITPTQYMDMVARLNRNSIRDGNAAPWVEREVTLHEQIIEFCRSKGWLCFHGSMAHRTHRTIGEPDFVICADHSRTFLIEAKSKSGKLRSEQQSLLAMAKHLGHVAAVVRSMAEFLELIKESSGRAKPEPSS